MTVGELIEVLKKCDKDLPVFAFECNDIENAGEVSNVLEIKSTMKNNYTGVYIEHE